MQLEILTKGYYQGTILEAVGARSVDVVMSFADLPGFFEYVQEQLRR